MATNLISHVYGAVKRIVRTTGGILAYHRLRKQNEARLQHQQATHAYRLAAHAHKQQAAAYKSAAKLHKQQVTAHASAVKARQKYFKARVKGVQAVTRTITKGSRKQRAAQLRTLRNNPRTRSILRSQVKYKTRP